MKIKFLLAAISSVCFLKAASAASCDSGSLQADVAALTNEMTTGMGDFIKNFMTQSSGDVGFRDLIQGMSEGQINQALQSDWAPMLAPNQYK